LRSSDVVARLGGDEFVVILEEAAESHDVERITRNLLSVLSEPLQLSGHECHTTASIGIAMYPSDGADVQTLTKNADMAMYLAKEDGKNGFRFFTKEIKTQSIERLTLESALRRALERDQFALHYQPKVDLATGQITGVEALLRWTHPELGVLPPMQFYSARRGNRVDRPDRPLGVEGSLRAKRGMAAPRIAAGIDGGESLAEAVR
jgi:predicted signal transduction protein with EAL and GGDEF domain